MAIPQRSTPDRTASEPTGVGPLTVTSKGRGAVGLVGLTAISISAMVGGGIYSLPGAVSTQAGPAACLIAWLITGVGMGFVVSTFRILAQIHPELTNGIYSYAEHGFGKVIGFLVMLGYWCTSCCAMATYGVLIMATLSAVVPAFGAGNTVPALIGASAVVWAIFLLARRGVEQASVINTIGTIAKFIPVVVFIVVCLMAFDGRVLASDFLGDGSVVAADPAAGLVPQVMRVLMVTLWVFIGIEGAVVVSGDATSQRAVGRAVTMALVVALGFYVLVSMVPFGLYTQGQIASMSSPSTAQILESLLGEPGRVLISVGIILSILSGWLVWMCMQGQMPTSAASDGLMPSLFTRRNRFGAPANSLLASAAVTQLFLILACLLGSEAWDTMVSITSVMTMPAYLFCCLFLVKEAVTCGSWCQEGTSRPRALVTGVGGSIFGAILVVAAGLQNLMLASIVFALGLPLLIAGLSQIGQLSSLRRWEKVLLVVLVCLAVASAASFLMAALGASS